MTRILSIFNNITVFVSAIDASHLTIGGYLKCLMVIIKFKPVKSWCFSEALLMKIPLNTMSFLLILN